MPNDHGVRVVDHDTEGLQATCLRRYGVTITDDQLTTIEVGMAGRRESAERIADAIRKAIEDARVEALDEAIMEVQSGLSLRALRGSIEQLKERNDDD